MRYYYYAGAQRVAMREDGTLYYLLSDHLGSTSLTLDASGNKLAEQRFSPWGMSRYTWGSAQTDYAYTGQRSRNEEFGLIYFKARWYDPSHNHFISPDTLIPDHYNPLDHNRYAYVRWNPIRYKDPSGHWACSDEYDPSCAETADEYINFMIATGDWKTNESLNVIVEGITIESTYYEQPDGSTYVSQREYEFNYMAKDPGSQITKAVDGVGAINDTLLGIQGATTNKTIAPDTYLIVVYSESSLGIEYSLDEILIATEINSVAFANVRISGPEIEKQFNVALGPEQDLHRKWVMYSNGNACNKPYSPITASTSIMLVVIDPVTGSYAKITIP